MKTPSMINRAPRPGASPVAGSLPAEQAADSLPASTQDELAAVLEQYVTDLEQGRAPQLDELTAAHPHLASLLPEYLEGVRLIHDALAKEPPAADPHGEVDQLAEREELAKECELTPPAPHVLPEKSEAGDPPTAGQIGDYELVRELGRGGMGIVYEARQISLNRRVALKMLPFAAVLDERQIARFRTEAQAAAGLHHPHIVPVFAVGQERGVHFYAMQFVDGQSLGQAIKELRAAGMTPGNSSAATPAAAPSTATSSAANSHSATTADALATGPLSTVGSIREAAYFRHVARLGAEAAEALEHAHQFGVVHRDIKPSNLVIDQAGKLWVTDFGLARVQSDMSVTMPGDVIGTLRYMSPEQARGRGDLVDGRTDVYALGATLYELVCLEPAHQGDDQQSLLEWINSAPLAPPRRLNSAVPVDLETIILRAMQHERDDRYTTAGQMADDLRRYLAGKPTLARRPGVVERAGRWLARRRKMAVAAGAMLALLAVVSTISAVWIASASRQMSAALAASEINRQRAEAHYQQARQAVDHFAADVADRLAEVPGAEQLTHELLIDTLGYYRAFLESAKADTTLEHDLAAAHFKSGAIVLRLGNLEEARNHFAQSVAAVEQTLQSTSDSSPNVAKQQEMLALALGAQARAEGQLGQYDAAERNFASSIRISKLLLNQQPQSILRLRGLAETLANQGAMWRRAGNRDAAATRIRQSIDQLQIAYEMDAHSVETMHQLAVAHNNLSDALRGRDAPAAFAASRKAVATMSQLAADQPSIDSYQADLAMTRNNLAALEAADGNWPAAAAGYGQAVEEISMLLRRQPLVPRYRKELAITQSNLGMALARTDQPQASDRAFSQGKQTLDGLIRDFPERVAYQSSLAALLNNQGVAQRDAGRIEQAVATFAAAVERQEQTCASPAPSARQLAMLAKQYRNYAELLRAIGATDQLKEVEEKSRLLRETYSASASSPASSNQQRSQQVSKPRTFTQLDSPHTKSTH